MLDEYLKRIKRVVIEGHFHFFLNLTFILIKIQRKCLILKLFDTMGNILSDGNFCIDNLRRTN